jgi:hypothetical protein
MQGCDYFVATLLRRGRVYWDKTRIAEYPGSSMGRNLLAVAAHCGQVLYCGVSGEYHGPQPTGRGGPLWTGNGLWSIRGVAWALTYWPWRPTAARYRHCCPNSVTAPVASTFDNGREQN